MLDGIAELTADLMNTKYAELLKKYHLDNLRPATALRGSPEIPWIVQGVLATTDLATIAGMEKCLKTSIAIDLAVSIATGTKFLGHFPTVRAGPVLFFSSETMEDDFLDTLRRICTAKGLAGVPNNLFVEFQPFPLGTEDTPTLVRAVIQGKSPRPLALIVDPWSNSRDLGGETSDSKDLATTNPKVQRFKAASLAEGCVPIILDHIKQSVGVGEEPLNLKDLAYTGLRQGTGQWVLIRRTSEYADDGLHSLVVRMSGRRRAGGAYNVEVDEGKTPGGRLLLWESSVTHYSYKATRKPKKEATKDTSNAASNRAERLRTALATAQTNSWGQYQRKDLVKLSGITNGGWLRAAAETAETEGILVIDRDKRTGKHRRYWKPPATKKLVKSL